MKKILFYASTLFLFAVTSCDNNSEKSNNSDSSKIAQKQDSIKIAAATKPGAINGLATIDNKTTLYKQLENTTIRVKYDYEDFMEAIRSWKKLTGTDAKEIYMVYAAYTIKDKDWYVKNHYPLTDKTFMDSILNQPCLLMGYPDPKAAGKFLYKEFGTICPPPTSCETVALIPHRVKFFAGDNYPGFDPNAMIDNFIKTYDIDASHPLTTMVKFNIDSISNLLTAAGPSVKPSIYFFMGAYDNNDANRYKDSHPGFNISAGEIKDRTCLLFALIDAGGKYNYFDFGTICPPDNSCKSTFK